MAEEEAFVDENGDIDDELRMLNEENELSVEELRQRYYGEQSKATQAECSVVPDLVPSTSSAVVNTPEIEVKKQIKDLFGSEFDDDEEDDDYVPKSTLYWKKEVRIGENYQVNFPLPVVTSKPAGKEYKPKVEAKILWRPKRTNEESLMLRKFLAKVSKKMYDHEQKTNSNMLPQPPQANRPPKSFAFADDEDALYALYKNDYNVEKTLQELPFPAINAPRITIRKEWQPMTVEDVEAFEAAFREYGKNFFLIQQNELNERSVGELVNFYYVWKKTERRDMFVETNRTIGLPPVSEKTVDPMEVLVDQQLGEYKGVAYSAAAVALSVQHASHQSQPKNWLSVQPSPSIQPSHPSKSGDQ